MNSFWSMSNDTRGAARSMSVGTMYGSVVEKSSTTLTNFDTCGCAHAMRKTAPPKKKRKRKKQSSYSKTNGSVEACRLCDTVGCDRGHLPPSLQTHPHATLTGVEEDCEENTHTPYWEKLTVTTITLRLRRQLLRHIPVRWQAPGTSRSGLQSASAAAS